MGSSSRRTYVVFQEHLSLGSELECRRNASMVSLPSRSTKRCMCTPSNAASRSVRNSRRRCCCNSGPPWKSISSRACGCASKASPLKYLMLYREPISTLAEPAWRRRWISFSSVERHNTDVGASIVAEERGTKTHSSVTKPRLRMSATTAAAPSVPAKSPRISCTSRSYPPLSASVVSVDKPWYKASSCCSPSVDAVTLSRGAPSIPSCLETAFTDKTANSGTCGPPGFGLPPCPNKASFSKLSVAIWTERSDASMASADEAPASRHRRAKRQYGPVPMSSTRRPRAKRRMAAS
mmetsp:Transcript_111903/g.316208  ORF Transcript_111903/g.316208 Transcript_111903/m.316208 type:complete len:294 (-) Transcript_111903:1235-2116(-)